MSELKLESERWEKRCVTPEDVSLGATLFIKI